MNEENTAFLEKKNDNTLHLTLNLKGQSRYLPIGIGGTGEQNLIYNGNYMAWLRRQGFFKDYLADVDYSRRKDEVCFSKKDSGMGDVLPGSTLWTGDMAPVQQAVESFKAEARKPENSPDIQRLFGEFFDLPDPHTMPECYRKCTFSGNIDRLVIVWGLCRAGYGSPSSSVQNGGAAGQEQNGAARDPAGTTPADRAGVDRTPAGHGTGATPTETRPPLHPPEPTRREPEPDPAPAEPGFWKKWRTWLIMASGLIIIIILALAFREQYDRLGTDRGDRLREEKTSPPEKNPPASPGGPNATQGGSGANSGALSGANGTAPNAANAGAPGGGDSGIASAGAEFPNASPPPPALTEPVRIELRPVQLLNNKLNERRESEILIEATVTPDRAGGYQITISDQAGNIRHRDTAKQTRSWLPAGNYVVDASVKDKQERVLGEKQSRFTLSEAGMLLNEQ
jgi:hypothetical protein